MKKPWRDGTLAVVFDPEDLLADLCAMVPPPRWHLIRFHGVLSAHASLRPEVIPSAAVDENDPATCAGAQLELFPSAAVAAGNDDSTSAVIANRASRPEALGVAAPPCVRRGFADLRALRRAPDPTRHRVAAHARRCPSSLRSGSGSRAQAQDRADARTTRRSALLHLLPTLEAQKAPRASQLPAFTEPTGALVPANRNGRHDPASFASDYWRREVTAAPRRLTGAMRLDRR
jgi:hypothetical protein